MITIKRERTFKTIENNIHQHKETFSYFSQQFSLTLFKFILTLLKFILTLF